MSTGLSSTMETIAIFVGMDMEKKHGDGFSLVEALEQFFQTMKQLRETKIVMSHENLQSYKTKKTFYSNAQIPQEVLRQKPLVLDPVDPFNNRLHHRNIDDSFYNTLSSKAEASLVVMREAKPPRVGNSEVFNSIVRILFPGPFAISSFGNQTISMPKPRSVVIERRNQRRVLVWFLCDSMCCSIKILNSISPYPCTMHNGRDGNKKTFRLLWSLTKTS